MPVLPAILYPGIAAICPVPFSTTLCKIFFIKEAVWGEMTLRFTLGLNIFISFPLASLIFFINIGYINVPLLAMAA